MSTSGIVGKTHETVLEATGTRARIARVYAEALLLAAHKLGQTDQVGEELTDFVRASLKAGSKTDIFMANNAIGKKTKAEVLRKATEGRCSDLLRNFLGVLNNNRRLNLLRAIAASYRDLQDDAEGRVRVSVTGASPMTESQLQSLTRILAETTKSKPIIETHVDADLIGGLVIRIGDKVYDTSVRSRLENLRTHLMTSGIHG